MLYQGKNVRNLSADVSSLEVSCPSASCSLFRLKRDCPTKVADLSPEQTESPVCDTNLAPIKYLKVENRSPSVELGDPLPSRAELHLRKLEKAYLVSKRIYFAVL